MRLFFILFFFIRSYLIPGVPATPGSPSTPFLPGNPGIPVNPAGPIIILYKMSENM